MPDHILFLTGKLAEKSLHRVLEGMQATEFTYEVLQIGVSVAALMTADLIRRRLPDAKGADRIVLPGRVRGDLEMLSRHYGVPVVRGPEEVKDLPQYFGRKGATVDLSRHDTLIFAEIVDAPARDVAAIVERARRYRDDGADVIDLGCLPDTPFTHLEDAVRALKAEGLQVSVDSLEPDDLLRGGRAGADYLLSLTENTLWVADEVESTPILIPAQSRDIDSLLRASTVLRRRNKAFFADPVLEPIHFGFAASLVRYVELRRRAPEIPIMMGIGNLTELTEADTAGINTLLLGIGSELNIGAILTTEVSPHCRASVREINVARRLMFASRAEHALPKGYTGELTALHEMKPFLESPEEIAELAAAVKDPSYRVRISPRGVHVFNRDGLACATDPFQLFPHLKVENDAPHAFYLGVELARAQIAWQLGKRYAQDSELGWGCAVKRGESDELAYAPAGPTLAASRSRR
jgi:dihydropteroate synthase-like protein